VNHLIIPGVRGPLQPDPETLSTLSAPEPAGLTIGDLDSGLIIDALFGPLVFRLVNGMSPVSDGEAAALADFTLAALAPDPSRPA
jgi:hypothetical protein